MDESISHIPEVEFAQDGLRIAARKAYSRLGIAFFVHVLVSMLLMRAVSYAIYRLAPQLMKYDMYNGAMTLIFWYGVGFLLVFLIARGLPVTRGEKRRIGGGMLMELFCITYFLAIIGNIVGIGINFAVIKSTEASDLNPIYTSMTNYNPILLLVMMGIVAPVTEELIFRKLFIDRTRAYGPRAAIIMSAVIWGLWHGVVNQFIYALLIGLVFGTLYARTNKIVYSMLLHAGLNTVSTTMSLLIARYTRHLAEADMSSGVTVDGALASMESGAASDLFLESIGVVAFYMFVIALIVTGVVFLIRDRKKFAGAVSGLGASQLGRGKTFKAAVLNPGMILCLLGLIAVMVYNFIT